MSWRNVDMYSKVYETKLVRVKHKVTIGPHTTAASIMHDLSFVPGNADLAYAGDSGEQGEITELVFVEEREELREELKE